MRGLSRRRLSEHPSIQAALTDSQATAAAMREAADTTHLFYAALAPTSPAAWAWRWRPVPLTLVRHMLDKGPL